MYEYLRNLDKDSLEFITEAAIEQYNIDKLNIDNEYTMSVALSSIMEKEEEKEADSVPESKRKKFAAAMTKTFKSLCSSAGNALDAMSKKLTKEEGMNIHDYLSSKEGQIRMDHDIEKIQDEVKKAAREGDALVQAISKGLDISDEKVDNFVTKTKEIFDNHGEAVITATAAAAVYGTQVTLYDTMKKKAGMDGIYQQCASMEGQTNIVKITNALANMFNKEMRIFGVFMSKFNSLKDKNK